MIINRIYLKKITLFFVSLILLGVISTVVMAAVSQVPLFLTTGAEPNVVFLMDSSGSMWNICWHKDYPADASVDAYPAWFNGFFDGANDNMVLKYDTNISRYFILKPMTGILMTHQVKRKPALAAHHMTACLS